MQRKVVTGTGDRGQPVYSWETFNEQVPFGVEALNGRKLEIARQLVAKASHELTLRGLSGLTVDMRMQFQDWQGNTRTFNFGWLDERDFRGRVTKVLVTEDESES